MEYDPVDPRQVRALAILAAGTAIEQVNMAEWRVPSSQEGGGIYRVKRGKTHWRCTCKDHRERGLLCKHIQAVRFHLVQVAGELLTAEQAARLPRPPNRVRRPSMVAEKTSPVCPHCAGTSVTRYG